MRSIVYALGVLVAVMSISCRECENLVEKMCTDLGPDDCAYWKQHGWDKKLIPGGRGVNKACGMMMGDNVYPELLKAQKNTVKVNREADARRAAAKTSNK